MTGMTGKCTSSAGRAGPALNDKEIYFMAHIKMLDMYDDIPDSYNIQKMIYNDGSTLQDLINHLKNQKHDAKPYDYNNKTMPLLVKDEQNGDCQLPDTLPETSETIKGGSMGLKIENKKSLKNEVSIHPTPLHDCPAVHDDVCVDTGATEDVLGRDRGVRANNKQDSNDILIGMGGEVKINKVGDYIFAGELRTEQGLINDESYMTCISVPDRTNDDWLFWADKTSAQLISPDDDIHDFTKNDGLYKLNKDQTNHKDIPDRLMNNRYRSMANKDPDTEYLTQSWVSKSKGMILYEAEPSTKASFSLREIDLGLKVWGFGFILDAQSNVPPLIPIALTSVKF